MDYDGLLPIMTHRRFLKLAYQVGVPLRCLSIVSNRRKEFVIHEFKGCCLPGLHYYTGRFIRRWHYCQVCDNVDAESFQSDMRRPSGEVVMELLREEVPPPSWTPWAPWLWECQKCGIHCCDRCSIYKPFEGKSLRLCLKCGLEDMP